MVDDRVATVATKLGDADIHVQNMEGGEELGRPFKFTVELLSKNHDLKLDDQLGQPLTVGIKIRDNKTRYFSGLVSQISYSGSVGGRARYIAIVRPWIWFLTYSSDNRIFQDKTVKDILADVFKGHGQSAKQKLSGTYAKRSYCVQYGETDFDFVSRLMEEEGIYYYFEHANGNHELILSDSPSAHSAFPDYSKIKYFRPDNAEVRTEDHVDFWEVLHQVETQKVVVESYNYETPKTNLSANTEIKRKHGQSGHELYEYGKNYPKANDGTKLSRVRAEEEQSRYQVATGGGNVMGVSAGCTFELEQFPRSDQNAKYLVISSNYQFVNNDVETGVGSSGGADFDCSFRVIPEQTPFRPLSITPKSRVRGPQTAEVVGPSGDEIYTDKYGRVKVQFHWDRDGKNDDKSSCWVRVSTAIAGQKWGMVAIPRIGQEVVVDFLEGDPDQPLIVGSVYNDSNMPPYDLPDNMTQSGFKSRSTKKGNPNTFNELRFEDKKGSEEVYVHAQRNHTRIVKNDDFLKVGTEKTDKGDQTIEIENSRSVTLHEGDDNLKVEKADQNIDVKKKINIKAGDQLTITVGQSSLVMKKNGDITIKGKTIKFDASMEIKGKAGKSVDLKAAMVKVNGSGTVEIKGGGQTKVEGSGMLDLKGGGMAKLKGGVTMIG